MAPMFGPLSLKGNDPLPTPLVGPDPPICDALCFSFGKQIKYSFRAVFEVYQHFHAQAAVFNSYEENSVRYLLRYLSKSIGTNISVQYDPMYFHDIMLRGIEKKWKTRGQKRNEEIKEIENEVNEEMENEMELSSADIK